MKLNIYIDVRFATYVQIELLKECGLDVTIQQKENLDQFRVLEYEMIAEISLEQLMKLSSEFRVTIQDSTVSILL